MKPGLRIEIAIDLYRNRRSASEGGEKAGLCMKV